MKRLVDKKRRLVYKNNEMFLVILKFILNNNQLFNNKFFVNNLYNKNKLVFKFLRSNSLNKIVNYCVISGRSRGVLKNFKISRIVLREYAMKGFIIGLYKSSW